MQKHITVCTQILSESYPKGQICQCWDKKMAAKCGWKDSVGYDISAKQETVICVNRNRELRIPFEVISSNARLCHDNIASGRMLVLHVMILQSGML